MKDRGNLQLTFTARCKSSKRSRSVAAVEGAGGACADSDRRRGRDIEGVDGMQCKPKRETTVFFFLLLSLSDQL